MYTVMRLLSISITLVMIIAVIFESVRITYGEKKHKEESGRSTDERV